MTGVWTVSWSCSVGDIDFETTADMPAESATQAVKMFCSLMKSRLFCEWEGETIRAEKNHTFYLFKVESNLIRRV